jgi:hypothetical protein
MEGGSSCSGIYLTSQNLYNCRFIDKAIALVSHGALCVVFRRALFCLVFVASFMLSLSDAPLYFIRDMCLLS